jgi:predicted ATPase
LIDQPEDNLDSEFIYKTIVKTLRKIKEQRQVIIVTHNPNIAVLGDAEVAIEFKSCEEVLARHIKGLKVFVEEHPKCRLIIVSHDLRPRRFNDVEVMPATYFLQQLWSGKIY